MLPILLLAAALTAQPRPNQPLAGPTVAPHVTRATLVSYDMSGRLRRLEALPELAALELLKLPADAQAKADAVIAERIAAMDRFVSENLLLLGQLDTASKAGGKLDQVSLLLQTFEKLRPALQGGPLRDRLIRALPAEHARRFQSIFDEYWNAAVSDSLADSRAKGKKDQRWQIDLGERFNHLAQEVGRSYERQAASGTIFFDYLLADLNLTDAQREIIRTFKLDMLERTGFRPSEDDQKQLGLGILAYLNQAQRLAIIRKITGK